MLTLNVKRNVRGPKGELTDFMSEQVIEAQEVRLRYEYDAEPRTNPPVPHQVVVAVDSANPSIHHEFDEGYVFVMNTHGKTVASYILGYKSSEVIQ